MTSHVGRLAPERVEAFVLAGGASRRMGRDKARLEIAGLPLAVHLARGLAPHVARTWLVAKPGAGLEDLGLPMLYDVAAERALVHGLGVALGAPGAEWRFVLACDMPAVDGEVLAALWGAARDAGARGAVPRLASRDAVEPLPSLWHRSLAGAIETSWGLAARDWARAAALVPWQVPEPLAARFANVNTPEEWRTFQAGVQERGGRCPENA